MFAVSNFVPWESHNMGPPCELLIVAKDILSLKWSVIDFCRSGGRIVQQDADVQAQAVHKWISTVFLHVQMLRYYLRLQMQWSQLQQHSRDLMISVLFTKCLLMCIHNVHSMPPPTFVILPESLLLQHFLSGLHYEVDIELFWGGRKKNIIWSMHMEICKLTFGHWHYPYGIW